MARSFNGSSDKVVVTQVNLSGDNTIAFWLNATSLVPAYSGLIAQGAVAPGAAIFVKSDGKIAYYPTGAGGGPLYDGTGAFTISTGAWRHFAVIGTTTSGTAYIDGNVDTGPIAVNCTQNVLAFGTDPNTAGRFFNGLMAEVALWNATLNAAEIAALAKGYSPAFIRPGALLNYWPLIGRTSPEIDTFGGNGGALTGTSNAPHPRIIMPRGPKVKRYRPVVVANIYVYMRPDADQSDGSWLNELGTNVDLYASVDETVASDTDYIQSSTTSGDKVRLQLSDPGSGVAEPFAIRYRASGVSGTATLFGRLYQGASTLIDSWNHTVDTTPTNYTHTLGSTEFALISDFNDLFIEFEYVT